MLSFLIELDEKYEWEAVAPFRGGDDRVILFKVKIVVEFYR